MKFLLIMHNNPLVWDALTEEERQEVMSGHGPFMETVRASGELVGTVALADPARSAVVRVRGGVPAVTDGPYLEAKEFLGGYQNAGQCSGLQAGVKARAGVPARARACLDPPGIAARPTMRRRRAQRGARRDVPRWSARR
ncbi:YciI family protein [Nonomuraea wenchangensis]